MRSVEKDNCVVSLTKKDSTIDWPGSMCVECAKDQGKFADHRLRQDSPRELHTLLFRYVGTDKDDLEYLLIHGSGYMPAEGKVYPPTVLESSPSQFNPSALTPLPRWCFRSARPANILRWLAEARRLGEQEVARVSQWIVAHTSKASKVPEERLPAVTRFRLASSHHLEEVTDACYDMATRWKLPRGGIKCFSNGYVSDRIHVDISKQRWESVVVPGAVGQRTSGG